MVGVIQKLIDRLASWLYRRGGGLADAADRQAAEKRDAVRHVRDGIAEAMIQAEQDRTHGNPANRDAAIESAGRAASVAHEIKDEDARQLVAVWKQQFDDIPKGWMESYLGRPVGYPGPAWAELKASALAAQERLGFILRENHLGR